MSCTPANLVPFPKCCGTLWLGSGLADPRLLRPGKPLTTSLACKSEILSGDSHSHLILSLVCVPRQTTPPSSSGPNELRLLEQTPQWLLVPPDVIKNSRDSCNGQRQEALGSTWLTTLWMGAFWALKAWASWRQRHRAGHLQIPTHAYAHACTHTHTCTPNSYYIFSDWLAVLRTTSIKRCLCRSRAKHGNAQGSRG